MNEEKRYGEAVITGADCGGKTSGMAYMSERFTDHGIRVFVAPEVATSQIIPGIPDFKHIAENDFSQYVRIEDHFLFAQLKIQEIYEHNKLVYPNDRILTLYDRGPKDIEAFLPEGYFQALCEKRKLGPHDISERFDAVIHMVTAAEGAEQFFTRKNNEARQDRTLDEVRKLDKKLRDAWRGHPHHRVIDNSTDFENKLKRAYAALARILGIPVPIEIERKFLLRSMPDLKALDVAYKSVPIEQMYISSPDNQETRIRKRGSAYYKTVKQKLTNRARIENECIISPVEYVDLGKQQKPDSHIIRKIRTCFEFKYQNFELDEFLPPDNPLVLLEIELTEENDRLEIPPYLDVEREVTDDPRYSNYAIAHGSLMR